MKQYCEAHSVELVHSGQHYFDVLERMIDNSRVRLHLQTYIFETDETGMRIVEALKRAAKRGVQVYVMPDAYASRKFSAREIQAMRDLGIHFRFFSPLFSSESLYFGRRLHHKIAVADGTLGLTGGINIANKYSGFDQPAWLDYAVLTTGPVCDYLDRLCELFYHKTSLRRLRRWEYIRPARPAQSGHPMVRFRRNDWLVRRNEIHATYAEAITTASTCITMVASYFLPGAGFRKLIKQAAKRGVEIRILLAGRSDSASVRLAEHYLYDFYLKNGIQIFEWDESVMHGKAMVVDNAWTTIGSYNLNFLSHYISIELNSDIDDADFSRKFSDHLHDIMKTRCKAIEFHRLNLSWSMRIKTWLAYHFYRWLMTLVVIKRKPHI